jgi:phosphoglycolate phosphatase
LKGEPVRLIVFDLDGTLIDSRRDIADAANALLASCGAEPLPEPDIGRMVGDGAATLVARAFAARGLTPPPDALDRYLAFYRTRQLSHTRPYPGIMNVLRVLGDRSTLAVLTNKPLRPTLEILDGLELSTFFRPELIVGGDGPFPRKPDAAGMQHLQMLANADAASTVLVGDSAIDLRTARAASTRLCFARYGFGGEGFPFDALTVVDSVVDAPEGLLTL